MTALVPFEALLDGMRDALVGLLNADAYGVDPATAPDDALKLYLNVRRRRISPGARTTARSRELAARALPAPLEAVVQAVEAKSLRGDDLNPFLSRACECDSGC